MLVTAGSLFWAAVVTIVLVYLWAANVAVRAHRNAYIKVLSQLYFQNHHLQEGLVVSVGMFHRYVNKIGELEGTDFISTKNFTEAEVNLLNSMLQRKPDGK